MKKLLNYLFTLSILLSFFAFNTVYAKDETVYNEYEITCNVGGSQPVTCPGNLVNKSTNNIVTHNGNTIFCNNQGEGLLTCTHTVEEDGFLWFKKKTTYVTDYRVKVIQPIVSDDDDDDDQGGGTGGGTSNTDEFNRSTCPTGTYTVEEYSNPRSCISNKCSSNDSDIMRAEGKDGMCYLTPGGVGETYLISDKGLTRIVVTPKGSSTYKKSVTLQEDVTPTNGSESKGAKKNQLAAIDMSQGVCQDFNICYTHVEEASSSYVNEMRSLTYQATEQCSGSEQAYAAFCLDPGYTNPGSCEKTKSQYHVNNTIDLKTTLGKKLYSLFQLYKEQTGGSGCTTTDYNCMLKYQTVARMIIYSEEERNNWSWVSKNAMAFKTHYDAWLNWAGGGVSGAIIDAAKPVYDQVMAKYSSVNATDSNNGAVTLTQIGSVNRDSGYFNVKYRITVKGNNISDINAKWSFTRADGGTASFNVNMSGSGKDENGNSYVEYVISGAIDSSDCSVYTAKAAVDYKGGSDLKNIYLLTNKSDTTKQRFLVFAVGGNGNNEVGTTFNPGNTTCKPHEDSCQTTGDLACAPTDGDLNYVTINEGVPVGSSETDWEKCIIGHSDSQDNSYDIEVQTKHVVGDDSDLDEELQDDLKGKLIVPGSKPITLTDASFCTISCKEQYKLVLPSNKKDVYKGTFFEFNIAGASAENKELSLYHAIVGIEAERKCVTSNSDSSSEDIKIDEYENRVFNLRKQQLDFMNAYEYYKALAEALASTEGKAAYIAQLKHTAEQTTMSHTPNDGFNYDTWKNGKGWNDVPNDYYEAGKVDLEFKYSQYVLTSDNADGEIVKKENAYTGNTKYSFQEAQAKNKTAYFVNTSNNYYAGVYQESGLFVLETEVPENKLEYSTSYKYDDTECVAGLKNGVQDPCASTKPKVSSQTLTIKFQKNTDKYKVLEEFIDKINEEKDKALEKVTSLAKQIEIQSTSIVSCTKYLESLEGSNRGYRFDPVITFNYDQPNYMSMLGNSRLILANAQPELSVELYYCDGVSVSGNAENVFRNCSKGKSSNNEKALKYFDPSRNVGSIEYNEVTRAGSISRYTCNNGYCYYRSATQFYTYPSDGVVTVNPANSENATLIQTDGRVYPVTITTQSGLHQYSLKFEQVGQYFESGYLGRIMGGNGSKQGTMVGAYKDSAVCTYDVPQEIPDNSCNDVEVKYCNGGDFANLSASELSECINQLINVKEDGVAICCSEAEKALNINKMADPTTVNNYNAACPNGPKACVGYRIINDETSTSSYDQALVSSNGDLNFTVRTVSLNNLFPNGEATKGSNWKSDTTNRITNDKTQQTHGLTINQIINKIQSDGESIYGNTPDYSFTLTPSCIKLIQEYNRKHEDEGGLNDYDLSINTSWDDKIYAASKASWEDGEFYKFLSSNKATCNFTAKSAEGISK